MTSSKTGGPKKPSTPSEKELNNLEMKYRITGEAGRYFGLKESPDLLEHFLDRTGEPVTLTKEKARTFDFIRNAEDRNRRRFEESFMNPAHRYGKEIRSLKDGQVVDLGEDHWNAMAGPKKINPYANIILTDGLDAYWAFGNTGLTSNGRFFASRDGDKINIHGDATHIWKDRYDFEPDGSGGADALKLEKGKRAKSFDFGAQWGQKLYGTMDIRNGTPSRPEFTWRDTPKR